jgi:hypothetical protein
MNRAAGQLLLTRLALAFPIVVAAITAGTPVPPRQLESVGKLWTALHHVRACTATLFAPRRLRIESVLEVNS